MSVKFHFQKIVPSAISPEHQRDGTYLVHSIKPYTIAAGEAVRVSTGLLVLSPPGTRVSCLPTYDSWDYNVHPDPMASVNFPELTGKGTEKPRELIILVRNDGMTEYRLEIGKPVARLEFVPVVQVQALETPDINTVIQKTETLTVGVEHDGVSIEDIRAWLMAKYEKDGPKSLERWLNDHIKAELVKYRAGATYNTIKPESRVRVEIALVMRNLSPDVFTAIRREMEVEKVADMDKPATPAKPVVQYEDDDEDTPVATGKPAPKVSPIKKPAAVMVKGKPKASPPKAAAKKPAALVDDEDDLDLEDD